MGQMKNKLIEKALKKSQDPVFRTAVLFILDDVVDKTQEKLKDGRKW